MFGRIKCFYIYYRYAQTTAQGKGPADLMLQEYFAVLQAALA